MVEVMRAFCWHQKFVPKGFSALALGLYACVKSLKMWIKSDFKEIILKLATYRQREKAFLLSIKFCPQCVVCPCPGLYTCGKTCIKSNFKEIVLKFATNRQREKAFLLSIKFCPQCVVCPCPCLYTCGKTCIKSNFKEIVLKLATNGQSDKGFLLTSIFIPYICIKALKYIPGPGVRWVFTGPLVLWFSHCLAHTNIFFQHFLQEEVLAVCGGQNWSM